jgi:hypothetical protein
MSKLLLKVEALLKETQALGAIADLDAHALIASSSWGISW